MYWKGTVTEAMVLVFSDCYACESVEVSWTEQNNKYHQHL